MFKASFFLMDIITVWKKIGETPLQATERARKEYNIEATVPGCFTGRLDPMAQGVLVVLFGEAVKKYQDYYNNMNKTYRFQAILGISTETYDPMGHIVDVVGVSGQSVLRFHNAMLTHIGKFNQAFPPYSAYRYKGHPLWHHAKQGTLPNPLPSREREIYSIKPVRGPIELTVQAYRKQPISDMLDVMHYNGDAFGCRDLIREWKQFSADISVWRIEYEATVSSGTYIRSLVHDLGHMLGIPAHASRITRVSVAQ